MLSIVKAMSPRLSPTSYALLGLLRLQPFSAYELTKYMRRSALARIWPRTETSIYREPKVLEAHGLVTATVERTGDRERTVYRITPAGRRTLRAWIREPGDDFRFECEAALKVFFADAGDLESLRSHLQRLARQSPAGPGLDPVHIDDFLDGRMQFPNRLQYTAMAADLIASVNIAVADWASRWLGLVQDWNGTDLDPTNERQARTELVRLRSHLRRRQPKSDLTRQS